mmetsp:Transcript_34361/g.76288  ORF Transcript_34361/g.76288 Transcript_34361/m.76288 type:complete len:241 (+) Transcript_34361:736-1458(+)
MCCAHCMLLGLSRPPPVARVSCDAVQCAGALLTLGTRTAHNVAAVTAPDAVSWPGPGSYHVAGVALTFTRLRPLITQIIQVIAAIRSWGLGDLLRLLLQSHSALSPHGVVANMDPLGCAPLDTLDDWAGGVEGLAFQLASGLDAVEQDGIPLPGLGSQVVLGTLREALVDATGGGDVGEHGLPTLLSVSQIHQDSGIAVASICDAILVEEVVPVGIVLLALVVPQHLQALAVANRQQGPC